MITQQDIKIAAYIVKALRTPNLNVFFCWGSEDYRPIEDGVQFRTNGFLHHGLVQVVYDHAADLFTVRLIGDDGETATERREVYVDQLQEVVDRLVESGDDPAEYESKINADPLCRLMANAKAVYIV